MGKTLQCQLDAHSRYAKKVLKAYSLKLNRNTDAEMIAFLESKEKYSVYIKQLIAEDMKKAR